VRRLFQGEKRSLNCFFDVILVSRPIRQPLAFRAFNGKGRTFPIAYAEGGTFVVTKIEFREVALQMCLADVVIGATDPALEDREIAFNGVAVRIAANVPLAL